MAVEIQSLPFAGSYQQLLLYLSLAGAGWFGLLTVYYAALSKRRAVVSMFASFGVAGIMTVWSTSGMLVVIGSLRLLTGFPSMSWGILVSVVELAHVISIALLSSLFVFNQWSVRKMFDRYEDLANTEVTRDLNEMVDVDILIDEFEVGSLRLLAVDDIEAGAHTMVIASPSLVSPALGEDVVVVKSPLVRMLEPEELETVLAHELAHIEELDGRFRPYFEILANILSFDPLVQRIKNSIRRRQEYGADERAVEVTGNPRCLARALVKVSEYESEMGGLGLDVKQRAERLVSMGKEQEQNKSQRQKQKKTA
ncbi:MAG: M48 family metalloprotease [Halobacteria archaeon]|nr:M48 family metalloprotease [Halobacteria archaeon]